MIIYEISPTTINLDIYSQSSSGELADNSVILYMINYDCWKWIRTKINQMSYVLRSQHNNSMQELIHIYSSLL